jgi:hypothetical protein
MKKTILILVAILTSTIAITQVRFNYTRFIEDNIKEDSTGYIYYTSDPDTTLGSKVAEKACIIYEFDNENEYHRYIPVNRTKVTQDEVIYFGKINKTYYKMIYTKEYGDFQIIERALVPRYRITLYFHRDYDYYDQLTEE